MTVAFYVWRAFPVKYLSENVVKTASCVRDSMACWVPPNNRFCLGMVNADSQ